MSVLPKITYNSIDVLFDRGVNVWNLARDQRRVENESASGIIETLSYFERERVAIQRRIASADLQAQLEQFWLYARTGQTFSFWRDRDLSAYWDFEGKSYTSNDGVTGTLTRATAATYIDPSTGLVTSVTSGNARFPTGKFGRGLLIETAATNLLLRSEEFDNATWVKTNVTVSANTDETKDPAGGTTSEKLTTTSTSATVHQDTSTNISTNSGVFTVWLKNKQNGDQTVTLAIYRVSAGTTLATSSITVTSTWQRFTLTYTSAGSITDNWGVRITFPDNAEVFYAWGAQLEARAAAKIYPTGYIVTTSATATRNAESLVYSPSTFFNDEPTQGSISLWFSPNFSDATDGTTMVVLVSLEGTAASDMLSIQLLSGTLTLSVYSKNNSSVILADYAIGTFSANTFMHIAVTWDTTIANGGKIYFNGVLVTTSTNAYFSVDRIGTEFHIGEDSTNTFQADGIIDELEIRKDVLTAAQIANYYNSGRAHGWRRNYYSSMLIDQDSYEPGLIEGGWRFDIPLILKEVLT